MNDQTGVTWHSSYMKDFYEHTITGKKATCVWVDEYMTVDAVSVLKQRALDDLFTPAP